MYLVSVGLLIVAIFLLYVLWASRESLPSGRPSSKIAIACTAKNPEDLEYWVYYHRSIGVTDIYLYLDETREQDRETRSACHRLDIRCLPYDMTWVVKRSPSPPDKTWDGPRLLVYKQAAVAKDAVRRAAEEGVDWLFHIDTDELLHAQGGLQRALENVPRDADTIFFDNWEVLPERDYGSCLREATLFRRDRSRFLHYINGKGACRPGKDIAPRGPHRFVTRGRSKADAKTRDIVVLHHVACTSRELKQKYMDLGRFTSYFGGIRYHEENMKMAETCGSREESKDCSRAIQARFEARRGRVPGERLEIVQKRSHGTP